MTEQYDFEKQGLELEKEKLQQGKGSMNASES
jgi:hypothetical protein